LLLALIWLALTPVCARAEFILTASSGVYQTDDGRTKVILSHKDGHQGIFVVHFKEGVAPQETSIYIHTDFLSGGIFTWVSVFLSSLRGRINFFSLPDGLRHLFRDHNP
jgi:hypothetical protein